MKIIYFTFFLLLSLQSCNTREKKIVLKTEKVYGLSNNSIVTLNNLKIGKVNIIPNQLYFEIIFNSENNIPQIPIDSKCLISNSSRKDKMELSIITGKSGKYFKSGDTLSWFESDAEKELEKSIMVGDFIFISKSKDSEKTK